MGSRFGKVFGLVLLLAVSSAHAYQQGKWYCAKSAVGEGGDYTTACQAWATVTYQNPLWEPYIIAPDTGVTYSNADPNWPYWLQVRILKSNTGTVAATKQVWLYQGCEFGTPDGVSGACPPPPPECSTQPVRVRYFSGGEPAPATFNAADGCTFEPDPDDPAHCGYSLSGSGGYAGGDVGDMFYCLVRYRPTGGTGTPEPEPGNETQPEGDPANPLEAPQTFDPTPTTSTETPPPLTEPNTPEPGDTTTTTTTTTQSNDPGPRDVTHTSTEITMTHDGDNLTTRTTTTTTTTHADGSQDITTQTTTQTTKEPSTTITRPRTGGTPSTSTSGGYSGSGTTTTNTHIGTDGGVTSSTSSSGDLNGNGTDDAQEPDSTWSPGQGGEFEDQSSALEAARAELLAVMTQVRTEASEMFDTLPTSGGGLPCFSFSVLGHTYQICLSDYEELLAPIGTALVLVSLFLGFIFIFR